MKLIIVIALILFMLGMVLGIIKKTIREVESKRNKLFIRSLQIVLKLTQDLVPIHSRFKTIGDQLQAKEAVYAAYERARHDLESINR